MTVLGTDSPIILRELCNTVLRAGTDSPVTLREL